MKWLKKKLKRKFEIGDLVVPKLPTSRGRYYQEPNTLMRVEGYTADKNGVFIKVRIIVHNESWFEGDSDWVNQNLLKLYKKVANYADIKERLLNVS